MLLRNLAQRLAPELLRTAETRATRKIAAMLTDPQLKERAA